MRVLLDTHALLWAIDDTAKLSQAAVTILQDPTSDLLVSAATIWELAIKVGLGKLTLSQPFRTWMNQALTDLDAIVLPITVEFADIQASLSRHHRDPFDRLLIAQAITEGIPVVSSDSQFDAYGVNRAW